MLDPNEKSVKRSVNSLANNSSLPVSLVLRLAVDAKDVDFRMGFKRQRAREVWPGFYAIARLCRGGVVKV